MAKRFLSNVNINDQYTLPSSDGTSGQIIQTDGAGSLSFIDNAADEARKIIFTVKNKDSISLSKGTVVHASPSANPPSGNIVEVIRADNDDSTKMPAIGILNETLAVDAEGECVVIGSVTNIATNSFTAGDTLYVSDTPGEFTNTKPTGNNNLIQKIGIVVKSHATNGSVEVFGTFRSNDVPNQIERNVNFTDNSKLTFGDSTTPDFRIYHEGTDSIIQNYTGSIYIDNNADDQDIVFRSDDGSGGLATYFKLDGSLVNGTTTLGAVNFPDKSKIFMGTGSDLEIYHDGSHSYIKDTGTGDLKLQASNDIFLLDGSGNVMIEASEGGSVDLFYSGSKKLETTSSGVSITGNVNATSFVGNAAIVNQVSAGTSGGDIKFKNNAGADRAIITDSGDVGIGTTSPASLLHIQGSTYNRVQTYFSGSYTSGFKFSDLNGGIWYDAGADDLYLNANHANSQVILQSGGSTTLTLDASNNATFAGTVQTTQITATNGLNYLKRNTDASLQLRSENTRSGLFITKPATDTVMGSALVLADESYRLGTASYYHMYMLQNGNTYFTQSVGIGTTSPSKLLHVNGSYKLGTNGFIEYGGTYPYTINIENTASAGDVTIKSAAGYNRILLQPSTSGIEFYTGNSERMRIDSSGRVGIGVTPNSWNTLTPLQIKNAALSGFGNSMYLTQNAYYDGAWKYIANSYASKIQADDGMTISVAANGTAGNAISFIDAISITNTGNATFAGTITASGGSSNNNDDANILTLNASEHARLKVDTSSTSGHRATLVLESNGNELLLSTTGSASELTSVGNLTVTSSATTFTGSVTIRKSALGGSTAMSDGTLVFGAGSTNYFSWRLDSGADLYLDKVYGGVNANVLSIDRSTTNGDVTFAGSVTAGSFIKSGGTSSQYLMADGSVSTITNNVTGTGVNNRLAIWNGTTAIDSDSDFYVDGDTIFTTNFQASGNISITGTSFLDGDVTIGDTNSAFIGMARAGANYLAATNASGYLVFRTAGSNERMRIDSSGNLGIGLTNPTAKLQVVSGDEQLTNFSGNVTDRLAYSRINSFASTSGTTTGAAALELVGNANGSGHGRHAWIGAEGTSSTNFLTKLKFKIRGETNNGYAWAGSSEAPTIMTLQGDGNVGIGVTSPNAKLSLAGGSNINSQNSILYIDTNSYYASGADRYITSSTAARYFQLNGEHIWSNAISGTAGNAISFTERMRINASGTIIGTGTYTAGNSIKIFEAQRSGGAVKSDWSYHDANTTMSFGTSTLHPLSIKTNDTERIRVQNTGNIGINTNNPGRKLTIGNANGSVNNQISLLDGGGTEQATIAVETTTANDLLIASKANLRFFTGSTIGNTTTLPTNERMRIDSSGNVSLNGGLLGLGNAASTPNIGYGMFHYSGVGLGIYSSASGATQGIGFWLNNGSAYEAGRFLSNGNLGIGTTSPLAKLQVGTQQNFNATGISLAAGASVGNLIARTTTHHNWFPYTDGSNYYSADNHIIRNASHSTEWMRVNSSGNVGIGTTSPSNKLDVKISTSNRTTLEPVLTVSAEGSGPYTGFGPKISFNSNIYYGAATGNPAGIIETAYIGAVMGTTYATNSDLVLATRDGATSVTEKMRILGNGNVGIGTTNPAAKLEVNGNIAVNAGQKIQLSGAADSTHHFYHDATTDYDKVNYTTGFQFEHFNSGVHMTIVGSSGNVGIGTTMNINKLDVAGNINVQGGNGSYLTFNNGDANIVINNNGSGKDLSFKTYDGSSNSERMRIDKDGKVGIGTTSPTHTLHVKNSSGDVRGIMIEQGVTNSYAELAIKSDIREFRLGTAGDGTNNANAENLFYIYDATTGGAAGHRFEINSAGDVQARRPRSNTAGDVALSLQPTDSTIHYGFRIDSSTNSFNLDRVDSAGNLISIGSSGNVGINTTSPDSKLDVTGGDITVNTTGTGFMNFKYSGSQMGTIGTDGIDLKITANSDLQLLPTGNVGIGTSSPQYDLHVVATIGTRVLKLGHGVSHARISTDDASKPLDLQINSQNALRIATNKDIGIGDDTPSYKLDVAGVIRATGDIIAFSDKRVKENIKTIDNSLEKVNKLRGVEFNKKGEDKKSIGVIAQEIEKILPEVVSTDDNGMKSVAYGNITGVLIEAIKELKQEIETLKTQINK